MPQTSQLDSLVLSTVRRMRDEGYTVISKWSIARLLFSRPTYRTFDRVEQSMQRLAERRRLRQDGGFVL